MGLGLMWWLITLLPLTLAQEYLVQAVKTPINGQIRTLHTFYVFSQEDSPAEQHLRPVVVFDNLRAQPSSSYAGFVEPPKMYKGLRMSIIEHNKTNNTLTPEQICRGVGNTGGDHGGVDVFTHSVSYSSATNAGSQNVVRFELLKTGIYVLVVSNCDSMDGGEAQVSGRVVVRNSYGFLPGNEYRKLPFYGWLWCCYVLLTVVWLGLSWRWKENVQDVHNCIYYVLLFGILECFMWYIYFRDWNTTGHSDQIYFAASVFCTSVKVGWSYMLLLAVSSGWGVIHPTLDPGVLRKAKIVCIAYIGLTCAKEAVTSFRHNSPLPYGALSVLPILVLNAAVFSWIFASSAALVDTLRARNLEQLQLKFAWFRRILLFTLGVAFSALVFGICDPVLAEQITTRWKYQWLTQDGLTQGLFVFVLLAAMYLWSPHRSEACHVQQAS